jgi:hypothetical protein
MNKPQEGALPYRPARARRLSCTIMAERSSLIRIVALITLASGVANIYWAMNPPALERRRLSHEILPLEFLSFPRSFTLLIGVALGKVSKLK